MSWTTIYHPPPEKPLDATTKISPNLQTQTKHKKSKLKKQNGNKKVSLSHQSLLHQKETKIMYTFPYSGERQPTARWREFLHSKGQRESPGFLQNRGKKKIYFLISGPREKIFRIRWISPLLHFISAVDRTYKMR